MDSDLPPENNLPPAYSPPPPLPPAFSGPPPIIPQRPARVPVRKGGGWKVAALVLVVLLALSMLLNFRSAVRGVTGVRVRTDHESGPRLEEVTVRDSSSAKKIAVVPIEGVITSGAVDGTGYSLVALVKEELKRAKADENVKAVLLKVDSPGGEVLASDEIANAIKDFQIKSHKPVVVSMGSLAASGGYYISAPCQWIVANELTITGSIGVIMHGLNYRGLLDKIGVRPEVFKSGKYKDMMSGTKSESEESPEERQMVQHLIDETFAKFKSVVRQGRESANKANGDGGKKLSPSWEDYADGRILSGTEALDLGFVDELGDFDVAVKRAETLATGGEKTELIEYQPTFDISSIFRLLGKTDTKAVKVDLGMDVPKLRAGYLYFLSSHYVQ